MLRQRSGFQPLSNHSFELIRYRLLSLKGGMRRTLPPHQQPTLTTPGAGAKTLADLS
jgi:hypothetical protein